LHIMVVPPADSGRLCSSEEVLRRRPLFGAYGI
jgi:hypothetical protein